MVPPRRHAALFLPLLGVCAWLLATLGAPSPAFARAASNEPLPIVVPQTTDLSLVALWVAMGAGYFAAEGVNVIPVTPPPGRVPADALRQETASVAVLAGPEYLSLLAARSPVVLAANLLENDPAVLVMKREDVARLEITPAMPVAQRLRAAHGMRLGVALSARSRLFKLYFDEKLDANIDRIEILKGAEQIRDFAAGSLDGLYTQSPTLESALAMEDAVVVVDPARGEVPELAKRLVEVLAVTRAFAGEKPDVVRGLVRAIGRAERLLRADPAGATAAVLKVVAEEPSRVARVVELYARAVPPTPAIEASRIVRELKFYPAGAPAPKLDGVPLGEFVFGDSAAGGRSSWFAGRGLLALACAMVLALATGAVVLELWPMGAPTPGRR